MHTKVWSGLGIMPLSGSLLQGYYMFTSATKTLVRGTKRIDIDNQPYLGKTEETNLIKQTLYKLNIKEIKNKAKTY